jgi:hypothetical protein
MRYTIPSENFTITGRRGPVCIACGNSRRFWIHTVSGDQLCELTQLPAGDVRILACGRCRSRRSIVLGLVD